MEETENPKTSKTLDKGQDKSAVKNVRESIDDSGIEMSEEKEKIEANSTVKCSWILGQLAWARGSSYPFWPCVVTLDPKTMLYYKVQNKGRSQALMVHVQYFGDGGRHNWVLSHYMMPFSGLDDFESRAKSLTPETKKKEPKYTAAFFPKLGVRKQWEIGVFEARNLIHLSNDERASIFEPVTLPPEQTAQATNNKLKRKLSTRGSKIPSDASTPGHKRLKKTENGDQTGKVQSSPESASVTVSKLETLSSTSPAKEELSKNTTAPRRKSTRNQNKSLKETADVPKRQYIRKKVPKLSEEERQRRDEIDFTDYYNLNKDFWKADHPDATDEDIKKLLQEMWDEMDAEEKSNNLNRNFDDYRYNSTIDQVEVKRHKQTSLQQGKENSKNTENSLPENKTASKLSDKNSEDSLKNNAENENLTDVPKTNNSPQKEKSKTVSEINDNSQDNKNEKNCITEVDSQNMNEKIENSEINISQKDVQKKNLQSNGSLKKSEEQNKIVSVSKNNSHDDKNNKSSKSEIISQNRKSEDFEMKDNLQKIVQKKNLEKKKPLKEVEKLCKSCKKNAKMEIEVNTERGEENDHNKEVKAAESTEKDEFLCKNCQKEKRKN